VTHLEEEIGKIKHYFPKIGVAIILLDKKLKIGEKIHIKGPSTDFEQTVASMQIDRKPIKEAAAGQEIGIKVPQPAHEKDIVFKKTI
jgi:hypothetical protein